MATVTPFTLAVNDLTKLGQDRAVEFFRRLLWAEATRVGMGRNLINVPQCINVGDGGIDAVINDANPSIDEIIPRGTSGFQIKSSDLLPRQCKKELHQGQDLKKPIQPEVKRLLDAGGTYVLVLFADLTDQKKKAREEALKDELRKLKYPRAKVRLLTASQMLGFAEQFPALVVWFKNDLSQCLPYSSWADRHDVKVPKTFIGDQQRSSWAQETRRILR